MYSLGLRTQKKDAEALNVRIHILLCLSAVFCLQSLVSKMFRAACFHIEHTRGMGPVAL